MRALFFCVLLLAQLMVATPVLAQVWPRLPLKDGKVLLSARMHSADDAGVWLLYPPDQAVYVKEEDLPDIMKAAALPQIRAAKIRVQNGQPAVLPRTQWSTIQTRRGEVLHNVKMVGVREGGIEVQVGANRTGFYIDGADMPAWLVPDVISFVQEEQRRMKAVREAVDERTYDGLNPKRWGDGTGRLTVKGQTVTVLELLEETPVEIKVKLSGGVAVFRMADLSPDAQTDFGYDPALEKKWPNLTEHEKAVEKAAWFERRRKKWEAAKAR